MIKKLQMKTRKKISDGKSKPLGVTLSEDGANFALYSRYAKDVYLLLFSDTANDPTDIIPLKKSTKHVWHVFVRGLRAGQLYGYKVDGPYDPAEGMRFNPHKLLADPYAKAFHGDFIEKEDLYLSYDPNDETQDMSFSTKDNTAVAPRSVIIDDAFDWQNDTKPNIPVEKLIIYETHIKGFTAHPSSKVKDPGTYLGFIDKIPYLKSLGINAVEFLPVHEFSQRSSLVNAGLRDYWGYNTVGFFAPEQSYAAGKAIGSQVAEFKTLVRELHKAGLEVIIDVVYNHTGEGNELGPTFCFRGIDNSTYYSLMGDEKQPYRKYLNDTGCGNTFNVENPVAMNLVLDSLRYWAEVMHVDGFRFDLASILARVHGEFSKDSAFFEAISKDPVLDKVKIIAEPWDLTTYQVGNFPRDWSEWNGKFRDCARKFILGQPHQAREMTYRLTGSEDLYGDDGRAPFNSINFITCHDGFTLHDLYAYNDKHNEANGEENRDGSDENHSWNCGAEGPTDDAGIVKLRKQMVKNALSCLLIPLGTPMLLGGDEFLRTQNGNNNAYCQDNETSWYDWDYARAHTDITDFTRKVIALRKRYPILQKRKFSVGHDFDLHKPQDISWCDTQLNQINWDDPNVCTICCLLDGSKAASAGLGAYFLFFVINAASDAFGVKLPPYENIDWFRILDTSLDPGQDIADEGEEVAVVKEEQYTSQARSVLAFLGKKH